MGFAERFDFCLSGSASNEHKFDFFMLAELKDHFQPFIKAMADPDVPRVQANQMILKSQLGAKRVLILV